MKEERFHFLVEVLSYVLDVSRSGLPLLDRNDWLILEDYLWVHGDRPRRVGGALLQERTADIERAFECGKALFIKFRG